MEVLCRKLGPEIYERFKDRILSGVQTNLERDRINESENTDAENLLEKLSSSPNDSDGVSMCSVVIILIFNKSDYHQCFSAFWATISCEMNRILSSQTVNSVQFVYCLQSLIWSFKLLIYERHYLPLHLLSLSLPYITAYQYRCSANISWDGRLEIAWDVDEVSAITL